MREKESVHRDCNEDDNLSEETVAALVLLSMRYDKSGIRKDSMLQNDESSPNEERANPGKRQEPEPPRIQLSEELAGIDQHHPQLSADIPPVPSLRGLVGECSKPFGKWLTRSDMNDSLSRLSFKTQHVKTHLRNFLEGKDLAAGIQVSAYDMGGKEYPMIFKLWSEKLHVLTSGWSKFRQDHGFLGDQEYFVTMWGFRHCRSEKLCFVIASSQTGSCWVEDEDIN